MRHGGFSGTVLNCWPLIPLTIKLGKSTEKNGPYTELSGKLPTSTTCKFIVLVDVTYLLPVDRNYVIEGDG